MSGSASLSLEQQLLEHSLGITPMPPTMQAYVALCLVSPPPSETTAGFEVSGNGYARVAATFELLTTPANAATNSAAVEFPVAAASWGTVGWFEVWDAPTGGNRLYWGELVDPSDSTTPLTLSVSAGDIVRFSVGTLTILAATAPTVIAVGGVTSFNTRAGDIILSNSDVVTVLSPSTDPPLMDGVAVAGASASWARGDHVHPTDGAATHNVGRNLLHNSLFRVAQRGTGPWTANGVYGPDRWLTNTTSDTISMTRAALLDSDRSGIGDESAVYCLQNAFTGNVAAGAYNSIEQHIESVRRLSGKTVTVSFWASATAGQKLGINVYQVFGTGGSPSTAVTAMATGAAVTLAAAWARYTATIALPSTSGKTLGTNGDDATWLRFYYSSGATHNAEAGNIGVQSGTINIWGVQLEVGSVATPLEKPDPQYDLANCRRFFQIWGPDLVSGYVGAASPVYGFRTLSPPMRATPAVTFSSISYVNASALTNTPQTASCVQFAISATAAGLAYSQATVTASADL